MARREAGGDALAAAEALADVPEAKLDVDSERLLAALAKGATGVLPVAVASVASPATWVR